jgi:hypothetical protein
MTANCFDCGRTFAEYNEEAAIWVAIDAEPEHFTDDGIAYKPYFDGDRFFCGCDEKEGWQAA